MVLSECWGGRVSDKTITQESRFLSLLQYGDVVLADRGFTVAEDIAIHGAKLQIPSFTRGKNQLTQEEVETSKELSHVRIHVEQVIGALKNRYTITSFLSNSFLDNTLGSITFRKKLSRFSLIFEKKSGSLSIRSMCIPRGVQQTKSE